MTQHYAPPVWRSNAQGDTRKVGFELEFAGLSLAKAAAAVAQGIGGKVCKETQAEYRVNHPEFGDFKIELDWSLAKNMARKRLEEQGEQAQDSDDLLMTLVTEIARQVVPMEVVCPPVPIDRLDCLDAMVQALREAGALGTAEGLLYAFGVHINAELPNTQAPTLVPYLQAYALAQSWLVKAHRVDALRRLSPYIDAYSKKYLRCVMEYTESTPIDQILDDYLTHNPTRNRGMDLLPLFKTVDEEKVMARVDDEKVNARPTFHYRLPNCEIEQSDWSLSQSWNVWCVVEHLAADPATLSKLVAHWKQWDEQVLNLSEEPWHSALDQIYKNLLSA